MSETVLPMPVHAALTVEAFRSGDSIRGAARTVDRDGRTGIHALSVHTRFLVSEHTLNAPHGSATLWVLPLEDLATVAHLPHFERHDPLHATYTLLADAPNHRDWAGASFAWAWSSSWYQQLFAKFYRGNIYMDAYEPTPRALVAAAHLPLRKLTWQQLGLAWDKPASDYRLYLNGVLVATSNRFAKLAHEPAGPELYAGNACLALSDLCFYDQTLSPAQMASAYRDQATSIDESYLANLRRTHSGEGREPLEWSPSAGWQSVLDLSLTRPEHLEEFYVQGCTSAPRVTSDGLRVTTPVESQQPLPEIDPVELTPIYQEPDRDQVYLWHRRTLEGDLALELEFMPLRHNGLCLLVLQASGMQREDFMADYPLRVDGSMSMLCWENVRSYHWEFFREMDDARNDVASHVVVKNPWLRPLGYGCLSERLALDHWHKIVFVQTGRRLRGACDGQVVFDVNDSPDAGAGPVFDFGRLGIRCMTKTDVLFRNLEVYNRPSEP